MDPPKNYKEIIAQKAPYPWFFLAKRSAVPPIPVFSKFYVMNSGQAEKLYGTKVPALGFWEHGFATFYYRGDEYRKAVDHITKLLFDFPRVMQHVNIMVDYCNKAMEAAKKIKKMDLTTLKDKDLFLCYEEVVHHYELSFSYGFITWCTAVLEHYATQLLRRRKEQLHLSFDDKQALAALLVPEKESLTKRKEKALDILSQKYKKILKRQLTKMIIQEKHPPLHRDIISFLKHYDWVGYDYSGPVLTYEEALKSIQQREIKHQKEISKKEVQTLYALSREEQQLFKTFSHISYTKDLRNLTDDLVHYHLDLVFSEIGRRNGFTPVEVRFLWHHELRSMLLENKKFTKTYLQEKQMYCSIYSPEGNQWKHRVGKQAKKEIETALKSNIQKDETEEVKGMPASTGKAKGKVKVVLHYHDIGKVSNGDILVTIMTSPRFMPAIARASAIITDEGGITCHAAIISRELGKPCIIGTRNATKKLKDGDMVEVDADKGVVRVIKRK